MVDNIIDDRRNKHGPDFVTIIKYLTFSNITEEMSDVINAVNYDSKNQWSILKHNDSCTLIPTVICKNISQHDGKICGIDRYICSELQNGDSIWIFIGLSTSPEWDLFMTKYSDKCDRLNLYLMGAMYAKRYNIIEIGDQPIEFTDNKLTGDDIFLLNKLSPGLDLNIPIANLWDTLMNSCLNIISVDTMKLLVPMNTARLSPRKYRELFTKWYKSSSVTEKDAKRVFAEDLMEDDFISRIIGEEDIVILTNAEKFKQFRQIFDAVGTDKVKFVDMKNILTLNMITDAELHKDIYRLIYDWVHSGSSRRERFEAIMRHIRTTATGIRGSNIHLRSNVTNLCNYLNIIGMSIY